MFETSTPSLLSFDKAVIASSPYLRLSNLPSSWRTRYAPSGRIQSVPRASVSSCNIETFGAVVMEVKEIGLKSKPSKRFFFKQKTAYEITQQLRSHRGRTGM